MANETKVNETKKPDTADTVADTPAIIVGKGDKVEILDTKVNKTFWVNKKLAQKFLGKESKRYLKA